MARGPGSAQLRVLEQAARGDVQFSELAAHALGYSPWYGCTEHRGIIESVQERGWASLTAAVDSYRTLVLTAEGRRVLEEARGG